MKSAVIIAALLFATQAHAMTRSDAIRAANYVYKQTVSNRFGIKTYVRKVKIQHVKNSPEYYLVINGNKTSVLYIFIKTGGHWVSLGCILEVDGWEDAECFLGKAE